MITIAIGALLTSSTFPMRAAAVGFPLLAALNLGLLAADGPGGPGLWFKLMVALDLGVGLLLVCTYGLYLARVHKNLMGRPIFIIDERLTLLNEQVR
jgi:ABC-type Mn2+/Zn2+ transport system permease subunit